MDVGLAILCLVLVTPLLALLGVAIVLESGRPILFKARRVGCDGRLFTVCKLRTMAQGAQAQLEALAAQNVGEGMVKIADDPRVTGVGRWLRRFSLDELPQLWNVLHGEMSLVGPRPHDASELVLSSPEHRERLSVKPGLTGLWQIRARSDPSLASRVYWDLRYVASCSLSLDLRIMLETIPAVLSGLGSRVETPNSHGPRTLVTSLGPLPPPRPIRSDPR
jgi:lipopolysaccharide/colanic/teichoic acid biosynthesis glycosyltransferase